MMKNKLLSDKEIDEIADRVIQRLNIKIDASEIIAAIDEINKRLNVISSSKQTLTENLQFTKMLITSLIQVYQT